MKHEEVETTGLSKLRATRRKAVDIPKADSGQGGPKTKGAPAKSSNVLLLLLPFWTPLIPPMGICTIKPYLADDGYNVTVADFNTLGELREFYRRYFSVLAEVVPDENKGNFYSIGHDVLRNHMMAYISCHDLNRYVELVRLFIRKTYIVDAEDTEVVRLNTIIDEYFERLQLLATQFIERTDPAILGLSVFKDTLPSSMFLFKFVKGRYPHITNIMGGPIFSEQLVIGTPDYEAFLRKTSDYIDKIMIGHGEVLLPQYLRGKLPASQRVYIEKEMNSGWNIPLFTRVADYSDINLANYLYLGLTASTGCPYRCSFCNVMEFFGPFQPRDIYKTVDEMEYMHRTYDMRFFFLTDHMVNPIANDLSEELIRRHNPFYWTAYVRVDKRVCNRENTEQWRKGGMYCARIGIESGSQRVLNYMGKGIAPAQSKLALKTLADAGVKTTAYFLVGHPGESESDFQLTLDFLEECADYIWEAECDYFHYNYSGQAHSDKWAGIRRLVYPEEVGDVLVCQEWSLDCEPSRDEIFRRVSRFANHCKRLGIPNTYTYHDIFAADDRWQKLHSNAVPALLSSRWTTSDMR